MATITGLTADRMLEIENESIVAGQINSEGHLILIKFDGTIIDAGLVVGPTGPTGAQGPVGAAGVSSIPGEVKMWSGTTLPVQATYGKWVWADGGVYATATYPVASGHINVAWKTAYGQSDPGAGNFRVPDLRGLVPAGLDAMPGGARANRMTRSVAITIAGKTGEETHVITLPEMAPHNHGGGDHNHGGGNVDAFNHTPSSGSAGAAGGDRSLVNLAIGNSGTIINTEGGGGAHENVQPTVFVPYIVRLDG